MNELAQLKKIKVLKVFCKILLNIRRTILFLGSSHTQSNGICQEKSMFPMLSSNSY